MKFLGTSLRSTTSSEPSVGPDRSERMERVKRIAWIAASVWLALSAGLAVAQGDGPALMRAGNEAFRSGDYALARDRYTAAVSSGYDAPLLYYNLGLAHYRLGEYAEAELVLEKASTDRALESLATYNLGLTSLAAGWLDRAADRFERVIAIAEDPALSALAERALERARIRRVTPTGDGRSTQTRPPWRESKPPIGDLYFVVAARYGTDDNIYRTPAAAYVDLAQTGQPLVVPVKQAASFMPLDLLALYTIPAEQQDTDFLFSYRLNADFYDSAYSNANDVTQQLAIGADVSLKGKHERSLETTFFGVIHDETNFDPDTGLDRDVGGQDISNRFSYNGAGLKSSYEHSLPSWGFGFDTRVERRSYDDAPAVTTYDHEFYHVSLWTERRIGESMELVFALQSYRREYDARRARDSNGVLSIANPTLAYSYAAAEVGVEKRLGSRLDLNVGYKRVERTDNFEGYADYSQNMLRFGFEYRPGRRLRIELWASARSYEYPNSFAFNDPVAGPLDIDSTDAGIDFDYRLSSRFSIWSELLMRDESSTDPRLEYSRNRAIIGIKWRH